MNPPNLETASAQEVFDFVVSNLLKQNKRSTHPFSGDCLYRNPHGLKCAGGWLIIDDEYRESFEGKSWEQLVRAGKVSSNHVNLINDLQDVHDSKDQLNDWSEEFRKIAKTYKLKWNH